MLGSTGSIGTQALDIIAAYPHLFNARVLAAGSNARKLIEQSRRHRPALAVIADDRRYAEVARELAPLGIEVAAGSDALRDAAGRPDVDTVLTATVGYSGLAPTLRAIECGKDIALANKETLVVAGELVKRMLRDSGSRIMPVDSEHSAIYQCLVGEDPAKVRKLIITASGGPFRRWSAEELEHATVRDALNHPNWSMGAKITIDSATMLNKAFEIIEARWLFDIPADRIEAVVHPQSIVHSMVQFVDGAVKAQLGLPDMHLPIRYALGDAVRLATDDEPMELAHYASLTFEQPDIRRFPCPQSARRTLERGGTAACIVNAANEVAVNAFLHEQLRFTAIYPLIEETLTRVGITDSPSYNDYVATNAEARRVAEDLITKL